MLCYEFTRIIRQPAERINANMAKQLKIQDKTVSIGDTIAITYKFKEKDKDKLQVFKGILIAIKGMGDNKMFTVRRMTKSKVGVERIFPVISPYISKIELVKEAVNTRRAKLYFLRDRSEREIKEKLYQ